MLDLDKAIRTSTSPTDGRTFGLTHHGRDVTIYWNGTGSPLYLIWHGELLRIDHPAADGRYVTAADARRAAVGFFDDLVNGEHT